MYSPVILYTALSNLLMFVNELKKLNAYAYHVMGNCECWYLNSELSDGHFPLDLYVHGMDNLFLHLYANHLEILSIYCWGILRRVNLQVFCFRKTAKSKFRNVPLTIADPSRTMRFPT